MKLSVTLLLLCLVVLPVNAESNTEQMCQYFARVAEKASEARDSGLTKEKLNEIANKSAPTEADLAISLAAIDRVFTYPRESPRTEGNSAYSYCVNNWDS